MAHPIVSRDAWLRARKELLAKEKELTRLRDELSRQRRALPWVRVEKDYAFDGPDGRRPLADLFDGRSQLLVQHFMFAPDWEAGCPSCSFWADGYDGIVVHLRQRDAAFVAVSSAPLPNLQAFARRMGWTFPWVSSHGSDFNADHAVSLRSGPASPGRWPYNFSEAAPHGAEMPGVSVFCKDAGGAVYHTYSCYARGLDMLNAAYGYLDLLPRGRDEAGLPYPMAWVRRHDEYAGREPGQ